MKTITVAASGCYNVLIGHELLKRAGKEISSIHPSCRVAIISDSNVWPLYGDSVEQSLICAGYEPIHFVFPAGEENKNSDTYLQIMNFLAEGKITRSDLIVALGGGVVGDISGFSAATYQRGIAYVQIPTSLLAMVDSSIGGKTAIDLPSGKNIIGAFKQPKLVLCDISVLRSLPKEIYLDGCAEIIKYSMLYSEQLFEYLLEAGPDFDAEFVVYQCVAFKKDVVEADEYDTGARLKLNLGHTIGHSIEATSNFAISHGKAVAAGMAVVTKAAVCRGLCDESVYTRLCALLQKYTLPYCTQYSAHELHDYALSDKKRSGGMVNLIIPHSIGNCDTIPIEIPELKSFIEDGLK